MRGGSSSRNLPAIGNIIFNTFKSVTGRSTTRAEIAAWASSRNKYTSKKKYAEDGTWEHEEIILKPLPPEYKDIVIRDAEDE
ncbi:MAG TPA: hypothetical protein PKI19_01030 [Elusimicrobiales bacterium]|nr:hypothetical protein [Elusimicrobiales bacterium]